VCAAEHYLPGKTGGRIKGEGERERERERKKEKEKKHKEKGRKKRLSRREISRGGRSRAR